jgi:hypothetical protein
MTPHERAAAELRQDLEVLLAEHPTMTAGRAEAFLDQARVKAVALHRLYVAECNRELTAREQERGAELELELARLFKAHGVGLYLNSDPRGAPVGFLTPNTRRFNTMGGAEAGWRL